MGDIANFNELLISTRMSQVELIPTLFSFVVCVLMSFIVRDFYIRRSFSLTGKMHIGSIIPVLSGVVFLVIVVVKSSLALSLGLVGALSIVRFRTPIKEPEELVYLFLAISVGLGYAAGHILITTILTLSILGFTYIWLSNRKISKINEYNLVINWKNKDVTYKSILQEVTSISQSLKLIRIDKGSSDGTAVMQIMPEEDTFVDLIIDKVQALDSEANVTFYEVKTNW
jgi:hypothetical protein